MDAEHLLRFHSQSCVFKFIWHSVDEALDATRIDKIDSLTVLSLRRYSYRQDRQLVSVLRRHSYKQDTQLVLGRRL